MNPKQLINGAALIRVSTAGQADDSRASIPAQREAIRRICATHGIRIAPEHHFELTDVSGASVLLSPDYQRFLLTLERADITAVVTKEFSRLLRPENFRDYAILQIFVDHGITLYMPDAVMNMANRQDWMMAGIKTTIAGMERFDIRQRMMDGKEAMRRAGRHPSAASTLARGIGYDKKTGWYYKEDEIAIVRMLFRLFLDGERNYHTLSRLTGIPRSSIRIILTNPVYAGVMTYRSKHDLRPAGLYTAKPGKRAYRRKIERRGEELIEVRLPLEPVVTTQEHRAIVAIVEGLRSPRAQARESAFPRFTYRGFLRCGSCGEGIYTHMSGTQDFYYCRSHSPRERAKQKPHVCENRYMLKRVVEQNIDGELSTRLTQESFLTGIIESHIRRIETSSAAGDQQLLEQRLGKLMSKRERIIELFLDGAIDAADRKHRLDESHAQIDQVKRQLRQHRPVVFDPGRIIDIVRVFREWRFLEMQAKRRILEQLLPEIFVDRYKVQGATLRLASCDVADDLKIGRSRSRELK